MLCLNSHNSLLPWDLFACTLSFSIQFSTKFSFFFCPHHPNFRLLSLSCFSQAFLPSAFLLAGGRFSDVFSVPNLEAHFKPKLLCSVCLWSRDVLASSKMQLHLSFLEVHAFSMFSFQPAAALVNVVLSGGPFEERREK